MSERGQYWVGPIYVSVRMANFTGAEWMALMEILTEHEDSSTETALTTALRKILGGWIHGNLD